MNSPAVTSLDFAPSAAAAAEPSASASAGFDLDHLEALVRRAQAGSTDAFAALVDTFGPRILSYLVQFTGHTQDAEDLTQDTFVKAFRTLDQFRSPRAFPAWLFKIARRTALNHFRRQRDTHEVDPEHPGPGLDPATTASARDEWHNLWQLARRLPADHREVLWLRYAEGLAIRDIARITRRTSIHVRVQLHRGRHQLLRLVTHRRAPKTIIPSRP